MSNNFATVPEMLRLARRIREVTIEIVRGDGDDWAIFIKGIQDSIDRKTMEKQTAGPTVCELAEISVTTQKLLLDLLSRCQ